MKFLSGALIAAIVTATAGQMGGQAVMHDASAQTYEHLANVILEVRETENSLMYGILRHYHVLAQRHLEAGAADDTANRMKHLELAAEEIANIANEGDKKVQSIKQRLLKAGHHHRTDKETSEDYIFINSKEKKGFLELAQHVAKMGPETPGTELKSMAGKLSMLFDQAVSPE
ncbi:MAG: hypothetical protein ACYTHJ_05335 [Planctomycetota bacterium]|jgi:hypothetical protein